MADVTITITGGALNESMVIPDATVSRINPMIEAFYAGLTAEDANLAEKLLAGVKKSLRADLFKYERQQARLSYGSWVPPDITGGD